MTKQDQANMIANFKAASLKPIHPTERHGYCATAEVCVRCGATRALGNHAE